jgi:type II secretory pathway pseudopilin PulG
VQRQTTSRSGTRRSQQGGDRGSTFVELLVAIALLGTVVVATLTGLRAAIIGSTVDESSARAHAWLQSASDELYAAPYRSCATNPTAAIESAYQSAVDASTRPADWGATSGAIIDVVSVEFLSRSGADDQWGSTCAADSIASPVYPQLVLLRVTGPNGDFVAELEVIKSV